jgi:hypothetical protein
VGFSAGSTLENIKIGNYPIVMQNVKETRLVNEIISLLPLNNRINLAVLEKKGSNLTLSN